MIERGLAENKEYLVISISFESVEDLIFEKEQSFVKAFLEIIADSLYLQHENLASFLGEEKDNVANFKDLLRAIIKVIIKTDRKVILMIDEVDKSSNNQFFLSFLEMLRNKYLLRNAGKDK